MLELSVHSKIVTSPCFYWLGGSERHNLALDGSPKMRFNPVSNKLVAWMTASLQYQKLTLRDFIFLSH